MIGRDASRLGRSVGLTRWCAPPQLARCGDQLLDTASVVSQSVHGLQAPRTVKFAPRRTPAHPAAALSAALSILLGRVASTRLSFTDTVTPAMRAKLER